MWNIELTELAKKNIKALDKPVQKKIIEFLHQVEALVNPRQAEHALKGSRIGQYWSYKVMKDYRVIVKIQDQEVTVIVVSVGNRKEAARLRPRATAARPREAAARPREAAARPREAAARPREAAARSTQSCRRRSHFADA